MATAICSASLLAEHGRWHSETPRRRDFQVKEADMLLGAILIAIVLLLVFILWAISRK
jgi:hypothetical protein